MEDRSGREVRVVQLMYKSRETGVRCRWDYIRDRLLAPSCLQ